MTVQEFKKYDGKTIANGDIIVGCSPSDSDVFVKTKSVYGCFKTIYDVYIPSDNERALYLACNKLCGYSYRWVESKTIKL